jgi:ADP-ribosyltransferase exoenzyme
MRMRLPVLEKWSYATSEELAQHVEWGRHHYGPWQMGLDPETSEAVEQYRRQSDSFNNFLRYPEQVINWSDELTKSTAKHVVLLSAALTTSFIPEDILVYRGLRGPYLDDLKIGSKIIESAFVATSLALGTAEEFSNWKEPEEMATILAIQVPSGHCGAWVDELSARGGRDEYEILLPPMTTLVVDDLFHVSYDYKSLPVEQAPMRRCAICKCTMTPR